jgi:hypothetical protein
MKTDNEFIAEFMGHEFIKADSLKYHSSWDWLMPVVKKLEKDHEVMIYGTSCSITAFDDENGYVGSYHKDSKIEAVYMIVLICIKWYNSKK